MILRTEILLNKYPININYHTNTLWLGSCFTTNMGKRMENLHFTTLVNPFGAIFNPKSLANSIDILLDNKQFTQDDIFENNGIWNSFPFHSQFSSSDKGEYLNTINGEVKKASNFLLKTDFLFITLGTAYTYQHIESKETVNNCHKLPAKLFNRKMLSIKKIVKVLGETLTKLYTLNSNIKVIFSVSPIRHLADGAHENQLSKSNLLLAVNELCNTHNCLYFPSYEILLDDLRDYRFYEEDMCHPNNLAQNYIWEKFANAFMDTDTLHTISEIESINKSLSHKALNPYSETHKKFVKQTKEQIRVLETKYPFLKGKFL